MKLFQEMKLGVSPIQINHQTKLMSIGSCFSTHIGKKFMEAGFNMPSQPFGQLYNPISIAQSLEILMERKVFSESDIFFHQEQFHSFAHHSSYSSTDAESMLQTINSEIITYHEALKNADILFITLGTSFVFKKNEDKEVVANCHKLPNHLFNQHRISTDGIVKRYNQLLPALQKLNPTLKIVFTVSPVRYLAFGEHENQLSKASLLLAIDTLVQEYSNCQYFPSYEIVIDELRDYRFFEEDFSHPTSFAVDYVWEKLSVFYFDVTTLRFIEKIKQIRKSLNHKTFNPSSEAHHLFRQSLKQKIDDLALEMGVNVFDKTFK